jgi:hypothetical protein
MSESSHACCSNVIWRSDLPLLTGDYARRSRNKFIADRLHPFG